MGAVEEFNLLPLGGATENWWPWYRATGADRVDASATRLRTDPNPAGIRLQPPGGERPPRVVTAIESGRKVYFGESDELIKVYDPDGAEPETVVARSVNPADRKRHGRGYVYVTSAW